MFKPPPDVHVQKKEAAGGGTAIFPSVVLKIVFGADDVQEIHPVARSIAQVASADGRKIGVRAIVTDVDRGLVKIQLFPPGRPMATEPARIEELAAVLGASVFTHTDPPFEIRVDSIMGKRN